MSKTIEIKKIHIRNFLLSYILGFVILYGLEHFGKFSYLVNSPKQYDSLGRVVLSSYVDISTKVSNIYFETFFKNKVQTSGNGFAISDINYSDSEFNKYSSKSFYYTKAVISDFKYGVYIASGLFLISLFLTNYKIKIS
jgi:hypothetical protein